MTSKLELAIEKLDITNANVLALIEEVEEVKRQRNFDRVTRVIHMMILTILLFLAFNNRSSLALLKDATAPSGRIRQHSVCEGAALTLQIINDNRLVTANPKYPPFKGSDIDVPNNPYC